MIETYGFGDLNLFQTTTGWALLSDDQRSIWVAYLRRSEVYRLDQVLRNIGARVDVASLNPATQPVATPAALPSTQADALPALNPRNDVPVLIPPSGEELVRLRAEWERAWKKKQAALAAAASSSSSSGTAVTLTSAEIQQVTARARQRSQEVSGHGRAPHGGYASSSSAATLAADRERSENKAIEKALRNALDRKKKGGTP